MQAIERSLHMSDKSARRDLGQVTCGLMKASQHLSAGQISGQLGMCHDFLHSIGRARTTLRRPWTQIICKSHELAATLFTRSQKDGSDLVHVFCEV